MDYSTIFTEFGPWGIVAIVLFVLLKWMKDEHKTLMENLTNHMHEDLKCQLNHSKITSEFIETLKQLNKQSEDRHVSIMREFEILRRK